MKNVKLNEFYTQPQVEFLLDRSDYRLRKLREAGSIEYVTVGTLDYYLYPRNSVDALGPALLGPEKYAARLRDFKGRFQLLPNVVLGSDYVLVSDVYNVWPYSREALSSQSRGGGRISRIRVRISKGNVWLFDKKAVKSYLLSERRKLGEIVTVLGRPYSLVEWQQKVQEW